ncbi:hypothetical protein D3C75_1064840 [compost metagenome]
MLFGDFRGDIAVLFLEKSFAPRPHPEPVQQVVPANLQHGMLGEIEVERGHLSADQRLGFVEPKRKLHFVSRLDALEVGSPPRPAAGIDHIHLNGK